MFLKNNCCCLRSPVKETGQQNQPDRLVHLDPVRDPRFESIRTMDSINYLRASDWQGVTALAIVSRSIILRICSNLRK